MVAIACAAQKFELDFVVKYRRIWNNNKETEGRNIVLVMLAYRAIR